MGSMIILLRRYKKKKRKKCPKHFLLTLSYKRGSEMYDILTSVKAVSRLFVNA